jgi:hypothetical protein
LTNNSGASSNTYNTDSTVGEPQVARKTTFKQNIPAKVKIYSGYYFDILKTKVAQLESTLTVQGCPMPVDSPPRSLCKVTSDPPSLKRDSNFTSATRKCSKSSYCDNRNNSEYKMTFDHQHFDSSSSNTSGYGSSFYKNHHPIDHSVNDVIRYQLYDNPVPLLDLPCSDSLTAYDSNKHSEKRPHKEYPNGLVDMENQIIDGYLNYTTYFRRTAPYTYCDLDTIATRSPASSTVHNQLISNRGFFSFKNRVVPFHDTFDTHDDKKDVSSTKSWKPVFTFVTTFIMIAYFIAELVKNSQYTGKYTETFSVLQITNCLSINAGKPIQISPLNVMVGPSSEVIFELLLSFICAVNI